MYMSKLHVNKVGTISNGNEKSAFTFEDAMSLIESNEAESVPVEA